MSQINLKKQNNSATYIPDVGYVSLFYSNELSAWAYKDDSGNVLPFASSATQARSLYAVVRNQTGVTIPIFNVVYISGSSGTLPLVTLAQGNSEAASSKTFAVTKTGILNNQDAEVIVSGLLENIDTSSFTAGDSLWLSPTVAGGVTTTKPTAPNHAVFIGTVIRSHPTTGAIEVKIQNGYELDELHNVKIETPLAGQALKYDGSLWINKTTEFEFTQSTASDTWTINHNLGFKPTVTVFSVGGMEVEADVQHTSLNQSIIYFNNPFAGSARLT